MSTRHSGSSNGFIGPKTMRGPEWDSRSSIESFRDMAEGSGPMRRSTRGPPFTLPCKETRNMSREPIDILLIEDNASDAELTVHAFQKHSRAKRIHIVRDGAEALDFFHCTGTYAHRSGQALPKLILLDLKLPLVDGHYVLRQ